MHSYWDINAKLVAQERDRAVGIHGEQAMGSARHTGDRFMLLVEEVGEVARALQEAGPGELHDELIQVAHLALAWAVLIDETNAGDNLHDFEAGEGA